MFQTGAHFVETMSKFSFVKKNCQNEKSREGGRGSSIQLISVSFHTSGRMQPGCDQDIYDNTNPLL